LDWLFSTSSESDVSTCFSLSPVDSSRGPAFEPPHPCRYLFRGRLRRPSSRGTRPRETHRSIFAIAASDGFVFPHVAILGVLLALSEAEWLASGFPLTMPLLGRESPPCFSKLERSSCLPLFLAVLWQPGSFRLDDRWRYLGRISGIAGRLRSLVLLAFAGWRDSCLRLFWWSLRETDGRTFSAQFCLSHRRTPRRIRSRKTPTTTVKGPYQARHGAPSSPMRRYSQACLFFWAGILRRKQARHESCSDKGGSS